MRQSFKIFEIFGFGAKFQLLLFILYGYTYKPRVFSRQKRILPGCFIPYFRMGKTQDSGVGSK